ncbi:MAG: YggS family pyridoxal phosphate-dependent enzyme [Candidatus Omnitrophota bacterium]
MISENLNIIRGRIETAAGRCGRRAKDIILVCVTKTVNVSCIEEAISAGISDIGESYVREASEKLELIGSRVRWHLIGHLQTNKVKEAVEIFDLIHSLDSLRLAEEISARAGKKGLVKEALIEVKTSAESAKYGVLPDELFRIIEKVARLPNLKIKGLMTMAPFSDKPEDSRPYFKRLKQLFTELSERKIENVDMRYLSMGMTQDFEIAIEEGANMVRIGRAIFKE